MCYFETGLLLAVVAAYLDGVNGSNRFQRVLFLLALPAREDKDGDESSKGYCVLGGGSYTRCMIVYLYVTTQLKTFNFNVCMQEAMKICVCKKL